MANDLTPYEDPGDTATCYCETAVTGKRFVTVSGPKVDGLTQVSRSVAGERAYGVAARDAAIGANVMVFTEGDVPVTSGAALTAGQEVQSDATGRAIPLAAGKSLGVVLDDVAGADLDAPIHLNL